MILNLVAALVLSGGVYLPNPFNEEITEEDQFCVSSPVPYYGFPLVTTKNVPGTGQGSGTVEVTFVEQSPFGVSVTENGSYEYQLDISLHRINIRGDGDLVAWVTTRDLSEIERLGVLHNNQNIQGTVDWNKYLVVITLEHDTAESATRWQGPIVMRGMSRSGMMHTMVGHGVLQEENCFAYGYDG